MFVAHISRKKKCTPTELQGKEQVQDKVHMKTRLPIEVMSTNSADPINNLSMQVQMLIGMVSSQQVMIQELISIVHSKSLPKISARSPTTRDIQNAAILQQAKCATTPSSTSSLMPVPFDIETKADPELTKIMYTPRENMSKFICAADTLQQAIDVITVPITTIKYPFKFDEDTGEIINTATGYSYGDIHKTSQALYDTITKAAFKIVKELLPTMTESKQELWTDILDTNSDAYRLLCMNVISRYVGSLVL